MLEFIPARILKKRYDLFGSFYSIDLNSGDRVDCRSVLEVVTKERKPSDVDSLLESRPDAIFIMMNPGSSKPHDGVYQRIAENQICKRKIMLTRTIPGTTQYQVMRVMHYCAWAHVRVINISDLRDPKSGKFVERFREIEKIAGFTAHSLFSDERNEELRRMLNNSSKIPIVCAWGVSSDLDPLIERCLRKVSSMSGLTGLRKPNTENKYFHPLPTLQTDKMKWVNNIVKHIKGEDKVHASV